MGTARVFGTTEGLREVAGSIVLSQYSVLISHREAGTETTRITGLDLLASGAVARLIYIPFSP
jgi:hypothetical protein